MSNNLMPTSKQYPAYKNSGFQRLEKVPDHWEIRKLRNILKITTERDRPDLPLLSVVREKGVIIRDSEEADENHNVIPEDLSNYKVVREGQFAMNKMKAWQGSYGVSSFEGIVSPAYFTFDLRGIKSKFFHIAIRSQVYVPFFTQASDGVRIGQWDLVPARMQEIPFATPPHDEQVAIVRYLDEADQQIKAYIDAKQRLIALLEEERRATTMEAIGSQEAKKYRLEVVAELVQRPAERTADKIYTPIGLYNRGRGIFKKDQTLGKDLGDSDFFWIEEGDLVISGQFAWEGAIALATEIENSCIASHRYPIIRGKPRVLRTDFLFTFFQTDWGQTLLDYHSRGAAGRNRPLNAQTLMKEKVSLPTWEQQCHVSRLLSKESKARNNLNRTAQLIDEYRTRLIADVVTGKLDVRKAAEELPEFEPTEISD